MKGDVEENIEDIDKDEDDDDDEEEENGAVEDDANDDDDETIVPLECMVCLTGERCFAFMPCGHLCVCAVCIKVLPLCPICRTCLLYTSPSPRDS